MGSPGGSIMKIPSGTAVFDVETKTIGNPYEIELSSLSIIFTDDGVTRFFTGDDDELRKGVEQLLMATRLVGFNSIRFDVPVILKYMSRGEGRKLRQQPHLDFFAELQKQKRGLRISLENFGKTTLDPLYTKFDLTDNTAIGLYKTNPRKFQAYNDWDSRITYLLLIHLYQFGYVKYTFPRATRLYIPNWSPRS